jgi:hypothetical protein
VEPRICTIRGGLSGGQVTASGEGWGIRYGRIHSNFVQKPIFFIKSLVEKNEQLIIDKFPTFL